MIIWSVYALLTPAVHRVSGNFRAYTPKGRVGDVPKPVGLKASEDVVFGINVTWGFPA
ncbi:hypothetical protein ACVXG7_09240 [Enterobacter hormaechei]